MCLLEETIKKIKGFRFDRLDEAKRHLDDLAIPCGSLGRLYELAYHLVEITDNLNPVFEKKVVFTMAGDHGIVERGVSCFPQEVTFQMVKNFIEGGASINAFAEVVGSKVIVVDMGVKDDLDSLFEIDCNGCFKIKKIRGGTDDFSTKAAMSREEAIRSVTAGIEVAAEVYAEHGLDLAGTGDMGIGNTTASSAVTAVMTGCAVANVTGRGTGIDDEVLKRKIALIEMGISVNRPDPSDAIDVLAKVGGFELGGIAGLILGCASLRIPVVIDGFISTSAALIARGLCHESSRFMISSHQSVEIGHHVALKALGCFPAYFDLNMRLGEGTGAALMFPFVEAAGKMLTSIKTFGSASVTNGHKKNVA